ncbi:MAG TPA: rRNA maturation RNase YbeY [Gammaproteobacteria bacterium]|nr:rRNA maturation RNase YbeY [Gammaproteobacteria bacterium]
MGHKPRVTLQKATREKNLPSAGDFNRWVSTALAGKREAAEMTIRIVDEDEGIELNRRYRHIDSATNVLSFPAQLPAGVTSGLLGDLVMCAPVVIREAKEQAKQTQAHWAHLTIHGTLHLLGFEHESGSQAVKMESLETTMLASLGYPDPYSM